MAWLVLLYLVAVTLVVSSPLVVAALVIYAQPVRRKRPGPSGFDVIVSPPNAPAPGAAGGPGSRAVFVPPTPLTAPAIRC